MERVTFLIEDSGERIECLLNPETVVLRRKAGIARYPALSLEPEGAIEDLVVRVGGGATEIELELLFDIQINPQPVNVDDVRTLTCKLWALTEYDGDQTRVPIVRMFWGKVFSMRVVFDALAERLDAISASGAARRSWITARLIRVAEPPRRTTRDVLANPRPSSLPGDQQSASGELADAYADAAGPPDADELERRAAIESGLWDWVRDLVEGVDAESDSMQPGEDSRESDPGVTVDSRSTADEPALGGATLSAEGGTATGGSVEGESAERESEQPAAGHSAPAASGDATTPGSTAVANAPVASAQPPATEPSHEKQSSGAVGRVGSLAAPVEAARAAARVPATSAGTAGRVNGGRGAAGVGTRTFTAASSRSGETREEHGRLYRLLVATPQQAAHRLYEAIRSIVDRPGPEPSSRPMSATARASEAAHTPNLTTTEQNPSAARERASTAPPSASVPPVVASTATERIAERLREATREPSQINQQFERYAEALERQSSASIRRAQEEQTRAMEKLSRQSSLMLQRFTDGTQTTQQRAVLQQQTVQRQNTIQLAALTQRIDHFMDRSSKGFQEGLQAQSKASEQLLTQISESWNKGERERARQLEQLLAKQHASSQACEASSLAVSREPRTQQLITALTALRQTPDNASSEVSLALAGEVSALLVLNASLTEALGTALAVLRDPTTAGMQREEAQKHALQVIEAELADRSCGRAGAFSAALKPPAATATRLDTLATTHKGNPAAWREVVELAPGQTLV
jgi:hypothetical protein